MSFVFLRCLVFSFLFVFAFLPPFFSACLLAFPLASLSRAPCLAPIYSIYMFARVAGVLCFVLLLTGRSTRFYTPGCGDSVVSACCVPLPFCYVTSLSVVSFIVSNLSTDDTNQ